MSGKHFILVLSQPLFLFLFIQSGFSQGMQPQLENRMKEIGKRGGRFVIGATSGPNTFNPIACGETIPSYNICRPLYGTLIDRDVLTGGFVNVLARHWEVDSKNNSIIFYLRRGIKFSNGQPILAEDIEFSYRVTTSLPDRWDREEMLVDGKRATVKVFDE